MKLYKEQREALSALVTYGDLRSEQLIKSMITKKKPREMAEKMFSELSRGQLIEEDGEYCTVGYKPDADPKMVSAFWVLLKYWDKINRKQHYRANYPAQIYFVRDSSQYEIVVINEGEESDLRFLFMENHSNTSDDIIKYIVIVQSTNSIEKCARNIPLEILENKQVMFATIDYDSDRKDPIIQYYSV